MRRNAVGAAMERSRWCMDAAGASMQRASAVVVLVDGCYRGQGVWQVKLAMSIGDGYDPYHGAKAVR